MKCIKNVIVTSYFIIFLSLIFVWYKFNLIPMKLLRLWEGFSDGLGVKEFAGKMFQGSRGTYSSGGLFMQLPPHFRVAGFPFPTLKGKWSIQTPFWAKNFSGDSIYLLKIVSINFYLSTRFREKLNLFV